MPKASEVAAELRKLADSLDQEPYAEIEAPLVTFYCGDNKKRFLNVARLFPRPFIKDYTESEITLANATSRDATKLPVWLRVTAQRKSVCRLVKPAQEAVYECEPLLSEAEEAQIEAQQHCAEVGAA